VRETSGVGGSAALRVPLCASAARASLYVRRGLGSDFGTKPVYDVAVALEGVCVLSVNLVSGDSEMTLSDGGPKMSVAERLRLMVGCVCSCASPFSW
jgi:pheromone shutdown protein TraB